MSSDSLRIMTYNIHHGSGNDDCVNPRPPAGEIPRPDCALDLPRLTNVIKAENPNIVGIQEVDRFWARSAGIDQPEQISSMLGMDYCFGPNLKHPPDSHADVDHEFGVATLTSYPIISCRNHLLPTTEGWEQRGMLDTRINALGIGEVAVLNTHLQVGLGTQQKDAKQQRVEQTQFIANHVAALDIPVIVVGDLNTEANSGDIDSLIGPESNLVDVWKVAGHGAGETIFAGAAGEPTARIDYILVSPHFSVRSAKVIDNDASRMASDHFPLFADLSLNAES